MNSKKDVTMLIPMVLENTPNGERSMDLYSRLLQERIVFLGTAIDDNVANILTASLLFLQSQDPKKDISMYINSPGGSCTAGLGIYDTMQGLSCDIKTYCVGQAASMGAVLLCAGSPGKRFSLPNSRIMIHQPWGGTEGTATDIDIQAKEIQRLKKILTDIIQKHSKHNLKNLQKDMERDFFMGADEAVKYGLVDSVVKKTK